MIQLENTSDLRNTREPGLPITHHPPPDIPVNAMNYQNYPSNILLQPQTVPPGYYQPQLQYIPPMNYPNMQVNPNMMQQMNPQAGASHVLITGQGQQYQSHQTVYQQQQEQNVYQQQQHGLTFQGQKQSDGRNKKNKKHSNNKNKVESKDNKKEKPKVEGGNRKKEDKPQSTSKTKDGVFPIFFPTKDGLVPRYVTSTGFNMMENIADKFCAQPPDSTGVSSDNSSVKTRTSYFEDLRPSSSEDNTSRRVGRPWPYIDLKRYSKLKSNPKGHKSKPIVIVKANVDKKIEGCSSDVSEKKDKSILKKEIDSMTTSMSRMSFDSIDADNRSRPTSTEAIP